MKTRCKIMLIVALAALHTACGSGSGNLEKAKLIEGRGIEPNFILGTTTLSQAKSTLGKKAREPDTSGSETTIIAGPLRFIFVAPEAGGEPVLNAISAVKVGNPKFPVWKGKSGRGIGLTDSDEQVRAAYGAAAAEWPRSFGGTALYYTSGAIVVLEPTVRELWVTVPFQMLESPRTVQSGQSVVTMQPRTSLRVSF